MLLAGLNDNWRNDILLSAFPQLAQNATDNAFAPRERLQPALVGTAEPKWKALPAHAVLIGRLVLRMCLGQTPRTSEHVRSAWESFQSAAAALGGG